MLAVVTFPAALPSLACALRRFMSDDVVGPIVTMECSVTE